jgi:hypothetical protein
MLGSFQRLLQYNPFASQSAVSVRSARHGPFKVQLREAGGVYTPVAFKRMLAFRSQSFFITLSCVPFESSSRSGGQLQA